jgi:hypothetical protein
MYMIVTLLDSLAARDARTGFTALEPEMNTGFLSDESEQAIFAACAVLMKSPCASTEAPATIAPQASTRLVSLFSLPILTPLLIWKFILRGMPRKLFAVCGGAMTEQKRFAMVIVMLGV